MRKMHRDGDLTVGVEKGAEKGGQGDLVEVGAGEGVEWGDNCC